MLDNLKAQKLLAEVRAARHLAAITIGLPQSGNTETTQLAQTRSTHIKPATRPKHVAKTTVGGNRPAPETTKPAVTEVAADTTRPIGDAAHGQQLARKCQLCHAFEPGRKGRFGPNLYGIVGQPAGKAGDYKNYSHALARADFVWEEDKLAEFICHSGKAIKKLTANDQATTRMPAQNTCGQDAKDVVAYLRNLKMQAANQTAAGDNPS